MSQYESWRLNGGTINKNCMAAGLWWRPGFLQLHSSVAATEWPARVLRIDQLGGGCVARLVPDLGQSVFTRSSDVTRAAAIALIKTHTHNNNSRHVSKGWWCLTLLFNILRGHLIIAPSPFFFQHHNVNFASARIQCSFLSKTRMIYHEGTLIAF